jgi:hypothetical protein
MTQKHRAHLILDDIGIESNMKVTTVSADLFHICPTHNESDGTYILSRVK